MNILDVLHLVCFLAPAFLMAALAGLTRFSWITTPMLWRVLQGVPVEYHCLNRTVSCRGHQWCAMDGRNNGNLFWPGFGFTGASAG